VLTTLLALAAAAGCEKTNDIPRLQEEAVATAKSFQERFDELAHRAEAIGKRARALPPSSQTNGNAGRLFGLAVRAITESRQALSRVQAEVKEDVDKGAPEALLKRIDELRETKEKAIIEATGDLAAVESWVAFTEQHPDAPAPPPSPEPAAADDPGTAAPPTR